MEEILCDYSLKVTFFFSSSITYVIILTYFCHNGLKLNQTFIPEIIGPYMCTHIQQVRLALHTALFWMFVKICCKLKVIEAAISGYDHILMPLVLYL